MKRAIRLTVNGQWLTGEAEPRTSLADFLREQLDLTGTHVGCEHGVCGACTVLLDGEPVRSCLMLAVQAAGRSLMTVEGLAGAGLGLAPLAGAAGPGGDGSETLHPLQEAFRSGSVDAQSAPVKCAFLVDAGQLVEFAVSKHLTPRSIVA